MEHKILEVGREEGFLVCLPLVIRLSAKSEPLRTSSSISCAKAKSRTLCHPMNNSHVADPSQALYIVYQFKILRSAERPDRSLM
jgi:hypothetical protein